MAAAKKIQDPFEEEPETVAYQPTVSATLKAGNGFEAPWLVYRGTVTEVQAMLTESDSVGLDKAVVDAAKSFADKFGPATTAGRKFQNGKLEDSGKSCPHGQMVKRSGTSAKGPWTGYFCPLPKGSDNQCKPQFV